MELEKLRERYKRGVVQVVQVTPFKNDGGVDYEGLKLNTSFLLNYRDIGPMILTPLGSTGEGYAVTEEEWTKIVKDVVDAANDKIPVVPGALRSSTDAALDRAKRAEDLGADGVMIVAPYYLTPDEGGLYMHFKRIADSINIGMVIYNNPDVSKVYIQTHLLNRIIKDSHNVLAVKENTPYLGVLREQVKGVGSKVPVLQGRGEWWFAVTAFLGLRGFVSGLANFMPEFCLSLLRAGLEDDQEHLRRAMDMLDVYEEFVGRMGIKYGPSTTVMTQPYTSSYIAFSVMKSIMDILGLRGGSVRLPLRNLDEKDRSDLRRLVLERMNLKKIG